MANHQTVILSLARPGCVMVLLWLLWQQMQRWTAINQPKPEEANERQERPRHAQSPRDCPACRAAHGQNEVDEGRVIEAWSKHRSGRGRPKSVVTDGHSCNNPACQCYQITDSHLHALVGNGKHYGADVTQYFKCQACATKVTARWNTSMYDLKTPARWVQEVLTATSEGVDIAAASRIFQHDERTIARWLSRMAEHSRRAHERFFHDLICQHLQRDELVTKLRGLPERLFIWVALDAKTKIIPVIRIGQRKRDDAHLFVHEVWQRLAPGAPLVFTTDGLWLYVYALTAHFGQWVPTPGKRWPVWQVDLQLQYGQVHKVMCGYQLKAMYTVAVLGTRAQLREALGALRLTGHIMTSYVERVNLTLREHVAPLSRRTWSLARDEHTLWMYLAWGRACYHFCRFHDALRLPTQQALSLPPSHPGYGCRAD